MNKNVLYVGIDVDDNSFHISAFIKESGEIIEGKCKPTIKSLQNHLEDLQTKFPDFKIETCYEATYIGFTLFRDLQACGFTCYVIAPSSIPRLHGNQVKTDRVDANKLAQLLSAGILTFVSVPDVETEKDRDLMRSRQFTLHQLSETRSHIQSLLRRNSLHYKSETNNVSHWTKHHVFWIEKKMNEAQGTLGTNLRILVQQMKCLVHTLAEYDKAVDELANSEKYQKQVNALICYHGIKNWPVLK